MSIVRVKTKGQVTLPTAIREQVGLNIGDLLEAKIERGKITLTPKTLVDRRLAEGLKDIEEGRTHGPFDTAEKMVASLHRTARKGRAKKSKATSK
jgi:AbrB family looped-hinge helix DNA binding protein